jgi:hypothetical protein
MRRRRKIRENKEGRGVDKMEEEGGFGKKRKMDEDLWKTRKMKKEKKGWGAREMKFKV